MSAWATGLLDSGGHWCPARQLRNKESEDHWKAWPAGASHALARASACSGAAGAARCGPGLACANLACGLTPPTPPESFWELRPVRPQVTRSCQPALWALSEHVRVRTPSCRSGTPAALSALPHHIVPLPRLLFLCTHAVRFGSERIRGGRLVGSVTRRRIIYILVHILRLLRDEYMALLATSMFVFAQCPGLPRFAPVCPYSPLFALAIWQHMAAYMARTHTYKHRPHRPASVSFIIH